MLVLGGKRKGCKAENLSPTHALAINDSREKVLPCCGVAVLLLKKQRNKDKGKGESLKER